MKQAVFHAKTLQTIRGKLGQAIYFLQQGHKLSMPHSRPMPMVADAVHEIRIKGEDGIYRVFYLAKSVKGILIIHAFMKKLLKRQNKKLF